MVLSLCKQFICLFSRFLTFQGSYVVVFVFLSVWGFSRFCVTDKFGSLSRSLSSGDGNEVYCLDLELVYVQEEEVLLPGMINFQQQNWGEIWDSNRRRWVRKKNSDGKSHWQPCRGWQLNGVVKSDDENRSVFLAKTTLKTCFVNKQNNCVTTFVCC